MGGVAFPNILVACRSKRIRDIKSVETSPNGRMEARKHEFAFGIAQRKYMALERRFSLLLGFLQVAYVAS